MPKDKDGFDYIFIVIDRLSKQAISEPCFATTNAEDIARLFIKSIYRYYRVPESIVSNRGPQFISQF